MKLSIWIAKTNLPSYFNTLAKTNVPSYIIMADEVDRRASGPYGQFPAISQDEYKSYQTGSDVVEPHRNDSGVYNTFPDISTLPPPSPITKLFKSPYNNPFAVSGSGITHKTWMTIMYVVMVLLLVAIVVMTYKYIKERKLYKKCQTDLSSEISHRGERM